MQDSNNGDTQPIRRSSLANTRPLAQTQDREKARGETGRRSPIHRLLYLAAVLVIIGGAVFAGSLTGLRSGRALLAARNSALEGQEIDQQYALAVEDMQAGRYDIARQRFEYVLALKPDYPGAMQGLSDAMAVLFATATPSPLPPTAEPTPTPDLRPIQELFTQAQLALASLDWTRTIDTLVALRSSDAAYQTARVDGMLFIALRNRGVLKILEESNLRGGMYDLTLAEKFAPLDDEARTVREWARIYLIGSGFWEAYPEQAVYYFAQVAAAAPYLHDASGWTAIDRYRESLIHLGAYLASKEDWCGAQAQYELAYAIRGDTRLAEALAQVTESCSPAEDATATATPTVTLPYTPTLTLPPGWITETPTLPWSTETPTPTPTLPLPSETPTPTETLPPPADTPTPTPTETLPPPPPAAAPATVGGISTRARYGYVMTIHQPVQKYAARRESAKPA
jgi:hypothetical protein